MALRTTGPGRGGCDTRMGCERRSVGNRFHNVGVAELRSANVLTTSQRATISCLPFHSHASCFQAGLGGSAHEHDDARLQLESRPRQRH